MIKKVLLILLFIGTTTIQGQNKSDLISHYEAYYKQMRLQGDVQGIIDAITHLNILSPSQARKDTLAYLYANGNRHLQALNTIGIERADTDSDLAIEVKAVSLKALNQPKRALEQYEALFVRKSNPFIAYEVADLKLQLGDIPGASEKIAYGIQNATDDMKYGYYESQNPYEVPIKAGFTYLKGLAAFNTNKDDIDAAVAIMDEALKIAPNFNLAVISRQALLNRKKEAEKATETKQ